jgi:hypothetical protein
MFGTGEGATDGFDELYGEDIFTQSARLARENNSVTSQRCWAYFEPLDPSVDIRFQDPDFAGMLRDIRSNKGDTTFLYKVKFSAGSPLCYPITVCMDPNDFQEGSRIIVRDILNGSQFSFNMREATLLGNGMRCITIRDASINSFIIEYTRGSTGVVATLLNNNWNFISLPVIPPNPSSNVIFPNATGTPFAYNAFGGWTAAPNMEFGKGYMIHYGQFIGNDNLVSGVRSRTISGIRVNNGWNAVGAPSVTACADFDVFFNGIGGGPTPALVSEVFDFKATKGYSTVAFLEPGHGYFFRVDQEGFYNVNPQGGCKASATRDAELKNSLVKMTVRDAAQNGQELYFGVAAPANFNVELPPIMRDFDARFANNGYISTNQDAHEVNLRSSNFPVVLNFENVNGGVEVRNEIGAVIGTTGNKGSVVINDANTSKVFVTYKQSGVSAEGFALEPNFPNPFANVSSFTFSVPSEMMVNISLTNSVGQEVKTLVNGVFNGKNTVTMDASELANGTYFYTMRAGSFVKTVKFTVNK